MRKLIARMFYLIILCYAAICAYLYFAQRSFLYFPIPARPLPQAEIIDIHSEHETLRIWAKPRASAGAVIYFGGNGEDVAESFDAFASSMPGRAVYLVNYRGYGGSTGTPSEAALFRDALAVYDWVRVRHSNVAVIGSSLGSGVAVYLAASRSVDRLVLVTPYDSIANVARGKLWLFPISFLLTDKFDSGSRAQAVKAKILILIAENDEMIPRARSDALVAKLPPAQVRVEVIRGATHNSIAAHPEYLKLVSAFL
jgi:pimeloyl-ACP methyl ester carboxylesterase